jgi:hypothetical protein
MSLAFYFPIPSSDTMLTTPSSGFFVFEAALLAKALLKNLSLDWWYQLHEYFPFS